MGSHNRVPMLDRVQASLAPWPALAAAVLLTAALSIAVAAPHVAVAAALVAVALLIGVGVPHHPVLLGALVLAIPFQRWTRIEIGKVPITAADVLLALIIATWLVRGLAERRLRLSLPPTLVLALLLFASAWLSTLAADDFITAAEELVKLAEMITIAAYGVATFRAPGRSAFVAQALVWAAAAESVSALVQSALVGGPASFALGAFTRTYGDFGQPNALAGYLAMALPIGVALCAQPWRTRPLMAAATVLIAATLAATASRGAWLGAAAALLVMGLLWSPGARRALAVGVLAAAAFLALGGLGLRPAFVAERLGVLTENFVIFDARKVQPTPANWSLVERMAHWQAGWAMALDHPVVGVGPGNYEAAYSRYFIPGWPFALGHAHNVYINTFAELGLIGLGTLLAFLATLWTRMARGIRSAPPGRPERVVLLATLGATTAFATHNFFDNMFVHGIGIQFGLVIGLAEAAIRGLGSPAGPLRDDRSPQPERAGAEDQGSFPAHARSSIGEQFGGTATAHRH